MCSKLYLFYKFYENNIGLNDSMVICACPSAVNWFNCSQVPLSAKAY